MGAWIEMVIMTDTVTGRMSHPTWVRGLKFFCDYINLQYLCVAPHVGAWIEIYIIPVKHHARLVAPHVGAWIEMRVLRLASLSPLVAPHVGAWIEIKNQLAQ